MKGSLLLFFMLLIFWLLLSGFDYQEIMVGTAVSAVVAIIVGYGFLRGPKTKYLRGFLWFLVYVPYFIYLEAVAHLSVLKSIITGKISPVILEVDHFHTHDWGLTVLSNSITMTPGTLTLEANPDKLYVHCLNEPKDKKDIAGRMEPILRRVWR